MDTSLNNKIFVDIFLIEDYEYAALRILSEDDNIYILIVLLQIFLLNYPVS